MERALIYVFISSIICLVMYLITAILFSYQNVNLHSEPVGLLAIILYFFIPLITIYSLKIEGN